MSLNKGNILRIITSNDHIINIEKEKSASMRRSMNEHRWIMSTGRETSSSHHRSKALKPGTSDNRSRGAVAGVTDELRVRKKLALNLGSDTML
jgi:hypothetical protein